MLQRLGLMTAKADDAVGVRESPKERTSDKIRRFVANAERHRKRAKLNNWVIRQNWLEEKVRKNGLAMRQKASTLIHQAVIAQPICSVDVSEIGIANLPINGDRSSRHFVYFLRTHEID
jgi:hypothetical protein